MKFLKKTLFLMFLLYGNITSCQNTDYKNLKTFQDIVVNISSFGEIGVLLSKAYKENNYDERLKYLDRALNLSKENKDNTLLPYIYYHFVEAYLDKANDEKALEFLNKIKNLTNWEDYNYLHSVVHFNLGTISQYNDAYDETLKNYETLIDYTEFEELKLLAKINIVGIHMDRHQKDVAKIYIDDIFEYYKKNNNKGLNHPKLALIYFHSAEFVNDYDEKVRLLSKSIQLAKEEHPTTLSAAYYGRGIIHLNNNKIELAIIDYNSALKILKKNKIDYTRADVYNYLAKAHLKKKNSKQALAYVDSSNTFIKNNDIVLTRDNFSIASEAYSKLGEFKKAYYNSKKYIQYKDSLISKDTDSLYIAYGKKYQTDKKIQENELLKKDNIIKDLEVKKQTTNRNYLLLFSALGLITLGVTYNRFRLKRKTADALATQNNIINNQKVALEKSNANKQRLFGIVAHDLVNPFNAILGYTKLLEEDYDSFNEEERKKFISVINKYANSNYNLTRTLLDWAKVQQDKLVVNKATLNCKDVVNQAIQPYQVLAAKKNIHINTTISENIFIEADKNMMQTVIGNLFVNAIKFTPENGEIKFHLDKNKAGTVTIEIEDSGIGMNQEHLNNLFDITKVNTRQGTSNEKGNGLGLILCKELIELQKGTLQMFSQLNKGSRAVVTI